MKPRLAWMFLPLFASVLFADDQIVTVRPEETAEILANPGMGWETFHCTAKQDKQLPSWIPSTVQYAVPPQS
jgi:hypothetical protein